MTETTLTRLPEPGDYGLTRGRGLGMAIVRWGTKSEFGHVCYLAGADYVAGRYLIVEAVRQGVRTRWIEQEEVLRDWVWSSRPLTDAQRRQGAALAIESVGRPYDWWSIFLFVVRFFLFYLRFWKVQVKGRSDDHADDTVICSEEVAWISAAIGDDPFPGVAPGDVSPGMLAQVRTGGVWAGAAA